MGESIWTDLALYVLLFFTYGFGGWLAEVILGYFQHRRWINRGFLVGPILPIYGFGGLGVTIFLSKYDENPITLFILALFICSTLEYFTSWAMEKIFKNRWWDYYDWKFNINGRICLECSCAFGLAGVIGTYVTNPFFLSLFNKLSERTLYIVALSLLIIFVIDIIVSFDIIINLKHISNSIKSDSTEIISKKVKEILLEKNYLYKRLIKSFPSMRISNTISYLKDKIEKNKKTIEKRNRKWEKEKEEITIFAKKEINEEKLKLKKVKKEMKKQRREAKKKISK